MADKPGMVIANETFFKEFEGSVHSFVRGETRVRVGHPILKGVEHLFVPLTANYEWEQATQAPAERREGVKSEKAAA